MVLKTINNDYNVSEFNQYVSSDNDVIFSEVDIVIDMSIEEVENMNVGEFKLFTIGAGEYTYLFVDYELHEYYETNGMVKLVCIKRS